MPTYRNLFNLRKTPQSESVPGKQQVENNAGGYVFAVDDWTRLDRFLILGSDKPTYYASARKLTRENAEAVVRCLKADGQRTVNRIVEISDTGRAPKNDPALFALAMASSPAFADVETRQLAMASLPQVARIGTHLFHFLDYVEGFRGWGRALRTAVANWYNARPVEQVAYQAVKYQQRDGWSHRDALRLSKPVPSSAEHDTLYSWIVGKSTETGIALIDAYEQAKTGDKQTILRLISEHGLTREMVPTEWLNDADVWSALLERMPLTAMVRNLGKMTHVGLLQPMNTAVSDIVSRLRDGEYIHKSRLHPLSILIALTTYSAGKGGLGSLTWSPVPQIIDALDDAFYLSFDNVEPTNKRLMLALDVSGSMEWYQIAGMVGVTPRVASAAMAMVSARVEPSHMFTAFSHQLVDVTISPRQRLDDVVKTVKKIPYGATNCSLPMIQATQNRLKIDAFVIYTDNETWSGDIHPFQALQTYRQKSGIPAKLIVVGMTSSGFSIADPDDGGMLDVVGFDTAAPNVMSEFINS